MERWCGEMVAVGLIWRWYLVIKLAWGVVGYLCVVLYSLIHLFYFFVFFFLMIRRPPRSTLSSSSAASDVYKRQLKTEHMAVNMQSGDMFPPHTMVTTYVVNLISNTTSNPYVLSLIHISEPTRQAEISYAVFCLKKKKIKIKKKFF